MLIHAFCKTCEHEIVLQECKSKQSSGSQLLQNRWIIKQIVILLWKNWIKYGTVSYLFSCTHIVFWWSKFFVTYLLIWVFQFGHRRMLELNSIDNFWTLFKYIFNYLSFQLLAMELQDVRNLCTYTLITTVICLIVVRHLKKWSQNM